MIDCIIYVGYEEKHQFDNFLRIEQYIVHCRFVEAENAMGQFCGPDSQARELTMNVVEVGGSS